MMKAILAALFIGAAFYGSYAYFSLTQETVEVVTTGKERASFGSGDDLTHKYLIFTETETFENTDTVFGLKFNSADIYGRINTGTACQFRVYGWRIPFLSTYRNILTASCTTKDGAQ